LGGSSASCPESSSEEYYHGHNEDIDTVVWENGADFSPDFLYEVGLPHSEANRTADK